MKKYCALLLLIFCGCGLHAKTINITLEGVMVQSKSILIGTYLGEYVAGKSYHIDVDTTIKGVPRDGIISVGKAKGIPRIAPGTKVMAFINQYDQWEWVGRSSDFSHGVIYLSGHNDFGAYDVYPDALSMMQLSDFMKTGRYSGVIEGNLRFWSFEKDTYESTATYFAIMYTYFNKDSITTRSLAGGLNTGTFTAQPEIFFAGSQVLLTYDDNPFRPLEIGGFIDSVKPNGRDFVADFQVWLPANLSQHQFAQYTAKPALGPLCYDLTVSVNGKNYAYVYGEEEGDIGTLTFDGRQLACTQASMPTDDQSGVLKFGTWSQTEVEIVLDEVTPAIDFDRVRRMPGDRMISILRFTPLLGEMFVYESGQRVSRGRCVIDVAKSRFTSNLSLTD
jgi:hypothetical protein